MDPFDQPDVARTSPRVDAILREAARQFDAPVALLRPAPDQLAGPVRAHASAAIHAPDGEHLGHLCILGRPRSNGKVDPDLLQTLATDLGAALSAAAASLPAAPDLRSLPHAPGSRR